MRRLTLTSTSPPTLPASSRVRWVPSRSVPIVPAATILNAHTTTSPSIVDSGLELGPDGSADQIAAYRAGDGESVGCEANGPGHLPPDRHDRCHCLHIARDLTGDDHLLGGECNQIAFDRPLHHHTGPDGIEVFGDGVPLRDDHDLRCSGLRGLGWAGTDQDEDARDSSAERRSR